MDLTFAINTHNNIDYLELCIQSIRENSFHNDNPILVYAENCDDGTNEWLEDNKEEYDLTFIIHEDNPIPNGIGGGMNVLAENVDTEYILFLHSDMYVGKDFDLYLYNRIVNHTKEPMIVSSHRIEPNIFEKKSPNSDKIWAESYGTLVAEKEVFGYTHVNFKKDNFHKYVRQFRYQNGGVEVPKIHGAGGYLIRTKDWLDIGGNDERFNPTSWEDMDLHLRMLQEGYKYALLYDSMIFHFGARGSHFSDDDFSDSSDRQKKTEPVNVKKFKEKWGGLPEYDEFGMPIKIKEENV